MAKNLDIPVSELIRRALDKYIDDKVDDGTLTRFRFRIYDEDRGSLEMPSEDFKKMYDYVKTNPGAMQVEDE